MRRVLSLAVLLGVLSSPLAAPAAAPPQKLALLVGIDDYNGDGAPPVDAAARPWSKLSGCVYDTKALRAELEKRGFKVEVRVDKAATKQGILDAIQTELVAKAKKGDIVLFHYSGHGQQVADTNGTPDEEDGYDETLVPYDNKGQLDGSANLRDDELGTAIAKLTAITQNVVVSLDSCHSGTATRGNTPRGGAEPVGKPLPRDKWPKNAKGEAGNWTKGSGYVLLAAAQPNELAHEDIDPESKLPMGAFTLNLLRVLRESDKISYNELVSRVGKRLGRQHPQIEGAGEKFVFEGNWSASTPGFRVNPIAADRKITIDAGTLLGLHEGDEVGLYPDGSGALDPAKPLARAKISKADLVSSSATLVPEDEKVDLASLKNGARALARTVTYPAARLVVAAPKTLAARDQLALPFVDLQEDATLVAGAARGARLFDLRVVQAGTKLELVRGDGTAAPIPVGFGEPPQFAIPANGDAATTLRQAIESHQRRSLVRALANKDLASKAHVTLSAQMVEAEQTTPGDPSSWKIKKRLDIVPRENGKIPIGGFVDFVVTNDSNEPLHIAIIDLVADGSVHVLYPPDDKAGELVPPGGSMELQYPIQMCPPIGLETFKLVATAKKVPFAEMEFAIRNRDERGRGETPGTEEESPIGQLFSSVGEATRGGNGVRAPARGMKWGVDSIDVMLVTGSRGSECPK